MCNHNLTESEMQKIKRKGAMTPGKARGEQSPKYGCEKHWSQAKGKGH